MRRRSTGFVAFLLLCFACLFVSSSLCQTVEPQVPVPGSNNSANAALAPPSSRKLRVGPGDLIEVSVYGVSDYKHDVRVADSGEVSLPLVGVVGVGGKTIEEAQEQIASAMKAGNYFRDPHVMVLIKDYASQGISIMGEVIRPGVYPAMSTRRLYDVVSLAGGFTVKAGKLVTITHRDRPNEPDKVMITNDPARSMDSNVEVYPGDTIVVSKGGVVYVVGDVVRPGGYVMEHSEHMTVLEAVALAQGPNRTAALGKARLIRRAGGKPQEIKVPLKAILAAKADDMELVPDDILVIPGSAAKALAKRSTESILQIATGLAIF
ncbi:MAG TPA: polysaccharide biosynthesis/export family protein [Terriglobales bacterium]|nr:polysaccharide biosynthesis/export family protein [Terriglobales bacterium]